MAQSDALISLIQSLSKSERRYFKMQGALQAGGRSYLGLFELLDKRKDAGSVKKLFEKQFSKSSYEAARKHLYKMLMRSLRNYETDKTIDTRLLNIIADVKILLNKGLLESGFSEIERGKKLALQHEKFFYFLILARTELQQLTLLEFPDVNESELLEKQEKINAVLYDELFINKHASLCEILLHRYIHQGVTRNEQSQEKLNDLLLEEFQINANQRYHNFQSDKLHLHFQSTYFLMIGDARQSLLEFYKLYKMYESIPLYWEEDPLYYIYLLNGILLNLRALGEYSEMKTFIDRLADLCVNSAGIQILIQHLIYQHSVACNIGQEKFDDGLEYFNQFQKESGLQSQAPPNVMASTHLITAILFFGVGDFRKSLLFNNKALTLPQRFISNHTYVVCRLLSLIIHIELNNDDLLVYAIKSFERKLKSDKILFQVEKITLEFLKKWVSSSSKERRQRLVDYAIQLKKIQDDKYDQQIFQSFDLLRWAEMRIEKASPLTSF